MQEEVSQKTVNLCIQGGRISANVLKAAMRKYLSSVEKQKNQKSQLKQVVKTEKAKVRAKDQEQKRIEAKKPHGKQTMKQLVSQNVELSNIPITDENIKSFHKVARKYGIDYTLKLDKSTNPPRHMVFFKARDVEVMTQAFKEYAGVSMKEKVKRPSIKKKLTKAVQKTKAQHREKEKQKTKSRGQER